MLKVLRLLRLVGLVLLLCGGVWWAGSSTNGSTSVHFALRKLIGLYLLVQIYFVVIDKHKRETVARRVLVWLVAKLPERTAGLDR